MNGDVTVRLRDHATWLENRSFASLGGELHREAADEIERLRAENQQLRERQELLGLQNLPRWKPSITPESLK